MKGKIGRPKGSSFTADKVSEILRRISLGESLRAICRDEGMPDEALVRSWAIYDSAPSGPGFAPQYAQARNIGLESQVDELLDVARDPNIEADHKRVLVDAIKWLACKLAPKRYGDRSQVELSGADGGPIKTDVSIRFVEVPASGNPTD